MQRSTSYIDLDVAKELEDRDYSISAKERDKDSDDTCFTKRLKLFAISVDNAKFDNNISEVQDN
jgi:hypothetical protein